MNRNPINEGASVMMVVTWKVAGWLINVAARSYRLFRNDPVQFMVEIGVLIVTLVAGALSALLFWALFSLTGLDKSSTFSAISVPVVLIAPLVVMVILFKTVFQQHKLIPSVDYMSPCRLKKDDESIMICISREIESRLEKWFDAEGRGLNERLDFVLAKGEMDIPERLVKDIRFIATIRNKVVHDTAAARMPERKVLLEKGNGILSGLYQLSHPAGIQPSEEKQYHPVVRYGLATIGVAGVVGVVFLMLR